MIVMAEGYQTIPDIVEELGASRSRVERIIRMLNIQGVYHGKQVEYSPAQVEQIRVALSRSVKTPRGRDEHEQDAMKRFMSHVEKVAGDHWHWTGAQRRGAGVFYPGGRLASGSYPVVIAARWIYQETKDITLPRQMVLVPMCGDPRCINPEHQAIQTRARSNTHGSGKSGTLQTLREERGWRRQDLAEHIRHILVLPEHVDHDYYTVAIENIFEWERGRSEPREFYKDALAQVYGLSRAQLEEILVATKRAYASPSAADQEAGTSGAES